MSETTGCDSDGNEVSAANAPFSLITRRETRLLARALAPLLESSDLLILDGQLGAGKTFFVRALCRALGLPSRVRVTSPTFNLVHEIGTAPPLSHADLYRLTTPRQVEELGLLERRDLGDVIVVEWGLPYIEVLGGDALVFEFRQDPRRVYPQATGPRATILLDRLRVATATASPARAPQGTP